MTEGTLARVVAYALTTVSLRFEHDVVLARQRARQIASLVGFDAQEQVRFATAVSELARNAFQYAGGGRVSFLVERDPDCSLLVARVADQGGGIANLEQVLQGEYRSRTGMGVGILGARRLADRFAIESTSSGTRVTIGKVITRGRHLESRDIAAITTALSNSNPNSPYEELQQQNQELLTALEELRTSKANVDRLNQELEETNRGVVALYAELDERANEMRRMSETKTRFLSDMSHELRTPLTSIINLSRLLVAHTDGELNEEQRRQVGFMQRSAESLVDMVSDLLDIAKIEAGRVDLRADTFTVRNLFGMLRGMFRPLATNDRVQLVFDEDSSIVMRTDEQRVSQVLRNLISNALKFTLTGEVRVSANTEGENVVFLVSDTGMGIAADDHDRIFEEFSQVDGPIQRRVRGTGLGLPLSRKLATLLGGRVTLESTLGAGSTFTLIVPREQPGPYDG